jgi:hypothetical protein
MLVFSAAVAESEMGATNRAADSLHGVKSAEEGWACRALNGALDCLVELGVALAGQGEAGAVVVSIKLVPDHLGDLGGHPGQGVGLRTLTVAVDL